MSLNTIKLESLFEQLVPAEGPAETVAGEIVRAANRLLYRAYNDGDVFWQGYGIETVGPVYEYLMGLSKYEFEHNELYSKMVTALDALCGVRYDEQDEQLLQNFVDAVVALIEGCPSLKSSVNSDDCLNYYELAVEHFGDPYYDPDEEEFEYDEDSYDPDDEY